MVDLTDLCAQRQQKVASGQIARASDNFSPNFTGSNALAVSEHFGSFVRSLIRTAWYLAGKKRHQWRRKGVVSK